MRLRFGSPPASASAIFSACSTFTRLLLSLENPRHRADELLP
jgi:hypothetical protein